MDFGQMLEHIIKTTDVAGLRVDVLATLLKDMGRREGAIHTLNFVMGVLAGAEVKLNGEADAPGKPSEQPSKPRRPRRKETRRRTRADLDTGLCKQLARYLDKNKHHSVDYAQRWSAWGLRVNIRPTDEMMAMAKGLGPDDFAPVRAVIWSLWGCAPHYRVLQRWLHRRARRLPVARAHLLLMTTRAELSKYELRAKFMAEAKKSHEALFQK